MTDVVPDLLTTAEVAEKLRCSKRYVCDLIKAGRLTAIRLKPGGRWRVHRESLEKMIGGPVKRERRQPSAELIRDGDAALARLGW